jgi:hypothetical protein
MFTDKSQIQIRFFPAGADFSCRGYCRDGAA